MDVEKQITLFFNIPYVSGVPEHFSRIIRNLDAKMSYASINKLNRFIRVQKDGTPIDFHKNVVYKISCDNCASYVEQTRRFLKTRIHKHRNHINMNTAQHSLSVITDHRNYKFEWNSVKILDEEPILSKRLTSEIIYIKRQRNSLNLQSDPEHLVRIYFPILESMLKI